MNRSMSEQRGTTLRDRYGPWALLTAAHEPVTSEFARRLAGAGVHLVLTGEEPAVGRLAGELRDACAVEVRPLPLDIADPEFVGRVRRATRGLEIGAVVCRVGAPLRQSPAESDLKGEAIIAELNLRTPARLARHYGERMAERGRGGLVFLAPAGARPRMGFRHEQPGDYNTALAEALWYELAPSGVDVLAVTAPVGVGPSHGRHVADLVSRALADLEQAGTRVPGRMGTLMNHLGSWIFSRGPGQRLADVLHDRVSRSNLN